jgi:glycosyltransferase involved in cell wall biosynthesis
MNLFLPSKLIEYLPLGIPLLGLTPRVGASADVLRALGYPIVPPTDTGAIARELQSLIEAKRSGRLHASPQHAAASARYDIRRTSAEFADVLASCLRSQ